MLKITEDMRESARKLMTTAKARPTKLNGADHDLLTKIANGTRKQVDARWWNEIHHVVAKGKLDKLEQLADPARNDNPHERALASDKLGQFKARRPPGARPEGRPLPKTWAEWQAKRKPTAKSAKRKAAPVNTTRPSITDRSSPDDAGSPAPKTTTTESLNPHNGQRGGYRAGAGRKVSVAGGRKQLTINLNARTVAALGPNAARKVEQIVEQYVANL
jgi:hypothetical protein